MDEIVGFEKRNFRRARFSESVNFSVKGHHLAGGCVAKDLSEGGLRINLAEFLPVHSEVSLLIRLSSRMTLECNGRVIWIEKSPHMDRFEAGLEFLGSVTMPGFQHEIRNFVDVASK